jgi:hypothetical protein
MDMDDVDMDTVYPNNFLQDKQVDTVAEYMEDVEEIVFTSVGNMMAKTSDLDFLIAPICEVLHCSDAVASMYITEYLRFLVSLEYAEEPK